jgi:asparagine synthase (glutamine-hydrolysing)
MCGIAGMVSFTRDMTDRQDLAERMSKSLAQRGPDQEGRWGDRRAVLTFRRLAVIDLAGGQQPMVAEDGAGRVRAVLDYTGEIFNVAELRADLSARGHQFREYSDTEVVLRAYLEWGTECAQRLRGMFAFAVWDAAQDRLVLIRDRFGIYPLYYTQVEDGFLFGSEPKALFASGLCRPVVDRDGLREVLGFTPTPGLSAYRGVREVIPGEIVTYDRDGTRRWRYWRLPAWEHTDDFETTARTVRDYLEDAVHSQLASDVPLSLLLSGGVDSSTLAALVAVSGGRRLPSTGELVSTDVLHTFSMDFAYHLTNFRPDEVHPTPDSPYALLMSRNLGTVHRELLLTAAQAADPEEQRAVLTAMDRPVARLDMCIGLRRLMAMARESSIVTMSGDGADELFGGYAWFRNPGDLDAFPWFGTWYYQFEMLCGLLDRRLVQELDLPTYIRDRYAEARAEVPHVDGVSARERRMREVAYLHLTRYLRVIIDRKDRTAMSVALEGRVPFCDHHLVEYVFNAPWAMKNANGRDKSLLRAAVSDLLPVEIVERRKSPFPMLQDPAYEAAVREQLRGLTQDTAGLLDPLRLKTALVDPAEADASRANLLSMETAIMLDLWIQEQGVTLAL